MPPRIAVIGQIARVSDLGRKVRVGDREVSLQFALYDCLRHEQALLAGEFGPRAEVHRILDLVRTACADLIGLLAGRDDRLLDDLRDGDWTLRDLLRHAIAVELRYAAQIEWGARRSESDPIAIPADELPCDRLDPPEPAFASTRAGGLAEILEALLRARSSGDARIERIHDAALDRPTLWGELEMPVRMRLHQAAAHLVEVRVQAEKMLGGESCGTEARRIIRQCVTVRGAHERSSPPEARRALDLAYEQIAQSER